MEINTFSSTNKIQEVLKNIQNFGMRLKFLLKKMNGKLGEYGKGFIKIKFNSDDNLPLNEILNLHMLTVVVRSVFLDNGKEYQHVF